MYLEDVHRMLALAIANGAKRKSLVQWEWDVAGRCQAPVTRQLHVRPSRQWKKWRSSLDTARANHVVRAIMQTFPGSEVKRADLAPTPAHWEKYISVKVGETPIPQTVTLQVKCRKCKVCLEERRRLWARRAEHEYRVSPRTWFGTLTLNPVEQQRSRNLAIARETRRGNHWEALSDHEQFIAQHRVISAWLTLYLKRLREACKTRFRYIIVAERHASGLPHYHLLVHEVGDANPVRKADLDAQWQHGFTKFRLVQSEQAARYVCKYLSKDASARVRASIRYGEQPYFNIVAKRREWVDPPF